LANFALRLAGNNGNTPAKVRRIGTMHPSFTSCSTPAETRRYAS
jgi:hypothetical protein